MSYELLARHLVGAAGRFCCRALRVMDGFDLGTAALLPFVARTDIERRIAINTVGPVWEGNQVWFILGGGAIFAAWPALYAASFSGFYLAMFLVLAALILRPVGIQIPQQTRAHRAGGAGWDWALFAGGVVPSLVFGVAFGNLFEGVPFGFDADLRMHSTITLVSLLNPFALLVGVTSLAMIVMHGACWLNLKTTGTMRARAYAAIPHAALAFAVVFALAGFWVSRMAGYHVTSVLAHDGPSNPLLKTVLRDTGDWLANFRTRPYLWIAPFLAFAGAAGAVLFRSRAGVGFIASVLVPLGTIATAGFSLFPFLLPSSSEPGASLTVWDASSSKLTLEIMLAAVVLILPVVLAYTAWVYRVFKGPVRPDHIAAESKISY